MTRNRRSAARAVSVGARVTIAGLAKAYGSVTALAGVDLDLPAGSFTALLGPSGCGKSTLLAVLAGLERPDAGTVRVDDRDAAGLRAEERPVGLVFQKPLLFPYLSVGDNVAFGLRMRRVPRREARIRADALLDTVGLRDLAGRRVGELSGGQEQRVALARALALRPRVLLLDEPFSQLDPALRAQMRELVREVTAAEKVTTLFVTHDLAEAVEVADEIALMLDGRIAGKGRPELFYNAPPSLAAARFFEATNEIPGTVRDGVFSAPSLARGLHPAQPCPDGPAVLVVRPESLRLSSTNEPVRAGRDRSLSVVGHPLGVRFAGTHLVVELHTVEGLTLRAHLPSGTAIDEVRPVWVSADSQDCSVFPQVPS